MTVSCGKASNDASTTNGSVNDGNNVLKLRLECRVEVRGALDCA